MHAGRRSTFAAALIGASGMVFTACSSLDSCALYGCPRLDVRNGKDCREVFAVNRDRIPKVFSIRFRYSDGKAGPVVGTSYKIGPDEELYLGCTPECGDDPFCWYEICGASSPCWYEIFDVKDAVQPPAPK